MSKQKFSGNISGKGYYIALILCAAAIGISGYLYYQNANDKDPQLKDPTVSAGDLTPGDSDIQAVAPQPGENGNEENQTPEPTPKKPEKTAAPVTGRTVAAYAMDCLSYNETTRDWRVHNGIDIAADAGTEVCAAADGTVYSVYEDETMGTTVVIHHDGGYVTRYSSLAQETKVKPGETVTLGQAIGCVGKTALLESAIGDHVHFAVSCNSEAVDPADFLG